MSLQIYDVSQDWDLNNKQVHLNFTIALPDNFFLSSKPFLEKELYIRLYTSPYIDVSHIDIPALSDLTDTYTEGEGIQAAIGIAAGLEVNFGGQITEERSKRYISFRSREDVNNKRCFEITLKLTGINIPVDKQTKGIPIQVILNFQFSLLPDFEETHGQFKSSLHLGDLKNGNFINFVAPHKYTTAYLDSPNAKAIEENYTWNKPEPPIISDRENFVGRNKEINEVQELLKGKGKRKGRSITVAIYGEPGVGKTHLVKHIASKIAKKFPGGVIWTDFSHFEISNNSVIAHTLQQWASFSTRTVNIVPGTLTSSIVKYAFDKDAPGKILVIMNDIGKEDIARQLLDILPIGSTRILITQNRQLAINLAGSKNVYKLEHLTTPDAIALLRDRIDSHKYSDETLEEIIGLLEHSALGIHTVSRLIEQSHSNEPVQEVIQRLKKRFNTGEFIEYIKLIDVFNECYENLGANLNEQQYLQKCLRRLGILHPTHDVFKLVAEQIWELDTDKTQEILEGLVNSNLLSIIEYPYFYHLHNLTHQYALNKLLSDENEFFTALEGYTNYFINALNHCIAIGNFIALRRQHDGLAYIFFLADKHKLHSLLIKLYTTFSGYLYLEYRHEELERWTNKLYEITNNCTDITRENIEILNNKAKLYLRRGWRDKAEKTWEIALHMANSLGDDEEKAHILVERIDLVNDGHLVHLTIRDFEEAIAIRRKGKNNRTLAYTLAKLGDRYVAMMQLTNEEAQRKILADKAKKCFDEAEQIYESIKSEHISEVKANRTLDEYAEKLQNYHPVMSELAQVYRLRGILLADQGAWIEAIEWFNKGLKLNANAENNFVHMSILVSMAPSLTATGLIKQAITNLVAAAHWFNSRSALEAQNWTVVSLIIREMIGLQKLNALLKDFQPIPDVFKEILEEDIMRSDVKQFVARWRNLGLNTSF